MCLCVVLTFVALIGVRLSDPAPALAASGTLTMETPLHESSDPSAPLLALLPEGTVVFIEGPPVDGFYPVTTSDLYGWLRGETMLLEKDPVEEGTDPATEEEAEDPVPAEQSATEDAIPPAETPTAVAAVDSAETTTDPAAADPAADVTLADEAAVATDATAPAAEPAPADLAAADSATETIPAAALTATPVPEAPAPDTAAPESKLKGEPAPDANPTPAPPPEPAPAGPASATVDMPVLSGPGPRYGLIFTVPMGSTVEQTGQLVDGYVSVQFKEVSGWSAREQLGPPNDFAAETPEETAEPADTRTPRPGSGVAFTTVDLSLRAGPSANDEPVSAVPAGSRVVLTGVMEGGFQRVEFREQLGWIAGEFLATPADPGTDGGGKTEDFSRQQIVRIIYDAADRYHQSRSDMLRVAECESNLNPYAVNPSGSYGLFQFIRSTWKSTPYGNEDVFDPRANANAASWMWSQGRKSEWVCQ